MGSHKESPVVFVGLQVARLEDVTDLEVGRLKMAADEDCAVALKRVRLGAEYGEAVSLETLLARAATG